MIAVPLVLVLEELAPTKYYRRHFLKFGTNKLNPEVEDLYKQKTKVKALAWVIRHFLPMVSEHPKTCWESLVSGRPLDQYMTTSDLAFAVLVLEHHMMQWRHLIHYELETGKPPSDDYIQTATAGMLLYKGGMAGKDAKHRFGELAVYFFRHFYNRHCPLRELNMALLQELVDAEVKADLDFIQMDLQKWERNAPPTPFKKDVHDDILHRVFHYMHF